MEYDRDLLPYQKLGLAGNLHLLMRLQKLLLHLLMRLQKLHLHLLMRLQKIPLQLVTSC